MRLLPRDEKFFELFCQHAQVLNRASNLLVSGLQDGYQGINKIASEMEELERQGDEIIHQIFQKLRTTFITPLDPEDIQTLATALDDVLDSIEDVTFRMGAYRLDPIPADAVLLGEMIDGCCRALEQAVWSLRDHKPVIDHCIEVNRLENEADQVERSLVRDLFAIETDAIALIKYKEIYELLEATTDRSEDVADILQSLAVKNS